MARGLSELQRFVLTKAGKKGIVLIRDIKVGFYGWKPYNFEDYLPSRWRDDHVFSERAIGTQKYSSVSVSINRALRRLERRGLIERGYKQTRVCNRERKVEFCRQRTIQCSPAAILSRQGRRWVEDNLRAKPVRVRTSNTCEIKPKSNG